MQRTTSHRLPDVFVGAEAVRLGLLTPGQLRGPAVQRVLRGVYRQATVRPSHTLACQAAALVIPASARITGRSMATVLGVPLASTTDPVEVVVPEAARFGPYAGLLVRRVTASALPGTAHRGLTLASRERLAFDLAARYDVATATAHLDAAARAGLLHLDSARAAMAHHHDGDVRQVRKALALADPRAESLPESKVRVYLALAGLRLVPQHRIVLPDGRVLRVDLADLAARVAVEYDGAWHALREQLQADRQRLNDLAEAGWRAVHITAPMLGDPGSIVRAVRAARMGATS